MSTLFTVGYGAWKTTARMAGLLAGLQQAGVTTLIDTRHSPCASATDPRSFYGPKEWNLQPTGGMAEALARQGIRYLWLVELGNPQKNDPAMQVLKWQLADEQGNWPIHRGLRQLADLIRAQPHTCCLLCACEQYETCHRRLVAEAVRDRYFGGDLSIQNIGSRRVEHKSPGSSIH